METGVISKETPGLIHLLIVFSADGGPASESLIFYFIFSAKSAIGLNLYNKADSFCKHPCVCVVAIRQVFTVAALLHIECSFIKVKRCFPCLMCRKSIFYVCLLISRPPVSSGFV